MDISLKVLNSSLPTSVHELSCNLCQGLKYQDFGLEFKSLSIEGKFNDFLCIKKDDCFKLVYIQNDLVHNSYLLYSHETLYADLLQV